MTNILIAAALVASMVGMATPAMARHIWIGAQREWTPWSDPACNLRVDHVYQVHMYEPINITITNQSSSRLRYTIAVVLIRQGAEIFSSSIRVDGASPFEQTTTRTQARYTRNVLLNTRISLRVTSCDRISG